MKKRQITIKDIAKALHISPSTVSRSLADHPDSRPTGASAAPDGRG